MLLSYFNWNNNIVDRFGAVWFSGDVPNLFPDKHSGEALDLNNPNILNYQGYILTVNQQNAGKVSHPNCSTLEIFEIV